MLNHPNTNRASQPGPDNYDMQRAREGDYTARPMSQSETEFARLDKAVDALTEMVAQQKEALAPVLRPMPAMVGQGGGQKDAAEPLSPICMTVRNLAERVEVLVQAMGTTRSALTI